MSGILHQEQRAAKRIARTQKALTKANNTVEVLAEEAALTERTISALEATLRTLNNLDRMLLISRIQALMEDHQNTLSAYHDAIEIRDAAKNAHATAQLEALGRPHPPEKCLGIVINHDDRRG